MPPHKDVALWTRARSAQAELDRMRLANDPTRRAWDVLEDGAIAQTCPTMDKERER